MIPKLTYDKWLGRIHELMYRCLGKARHWIWSFYDSFPPYEILDGQLDIKEVSRDGRYLVSVRNNWVEIDKETYGILVTGELLRVRCTRGKRAVSIDRIVPDRGPG